MSSSTVTYTSVYTDSDPWRFQWVSDEEQKAPAEEPPFLDYVSGPEHLPSPNYVPGLEEPEQAPLSPNYVPKPEYLEYLAPSDSEAPIEDQSLLDDASPTALSPGYIAGSDSEEDPEEDHADYPVDGGDDNDDDDDKEEEQEDSEDDDEEDEEHLAPTDSFVVPADDPVPLAEDTEAFETNESAPTHIPSPPLHVPSPPLHLPLPTVDSSTYAEAPLGYRAAKIRLRAVSPPTHHPSEILSPPLLLPSTLYIDDIPVPKANCSLGRGKLLFVVMRDHDHEVISFWVLKWVLANWFNVVIFHPGETIKPSSPSMLCASSDRLDLCYQILLNELFLADLVDLVSSMLAMSVYKPWKCGYIEPSSQTYKIQPTKESQT
ncbi:hypothetical protein Tco_0929523 [Tanacetum coccineum]